VGSNLQINSYLTILLPNSQINADFVVDSVYYNYDKNIYEVELTKVKSAWSASTEYRNINILKKSLINSNNIYFSSIGSLFDDLSADNKLTPVEKKQLQKIYDSIVSEKSIVDSTADYYNIDRDDYDTAYTTLKTYLDSLHLTNMSLTENITKTTFNTNFKNYYDERATIYEQVSNKSSIRIEGVESTLNDISADDKLTPVEKQQVKQIWDRIQDEYTPTTTTATNYGLSYDNYETAYNTLNSYVPNLLTDMTTTSTIDRTTFNNNFNNYYKELKNILDNTDIKTEQSLDNKVISYGTNVFKLGKNAFSIGGGNTADGLHIGAGGRLLIGEAYDSDKRLYYDGTNLELIGGNLKLSSTEGEIQFLDSGWTVSDDSNPEIYSSDNGLFTNKYTDYYDSGGSIVPMLSSQATNVLIAKIYGTDTSDKINSFKNININKTPNYGTINRETTLDIELPLNLSTQNIGVNTLVKTMHLIDRDDGNDLQGYHNIYYYTDAYHSSTNDYREVTGGITWSIPDVSVNPPHRSAAILMRYSEDNEGIVTNQYLQFQPPRLNISTVYNAYGGLKVTPVKLTFSTAFLIDENKPVMTVDDNGIVIRDESDSSDNEAYVNCGGIGLRPKSGGTFIAAIGEHYLAPPILSSTPSWAPHGGMYYNSSDNYLYININGSWRRVSTFI